MFMKKTKVKLDVMRRVQLGRH